MCYFKGEFDPSESQTPASNVKPVKISSRIVFLKVGQVDTRNERFDAEAYIECSWEDDQIFKVLADPNMVKNSKLKKNKKTHTQVFIDV